MKCECDLHTEEQKDESSLPPVKVKKTRGRKPHVNWDQEGKDKIDDLMEQVKQPGLSAATIKKLKNTATAQESRMKKKQELVDLKEEVKQKRARFEELADFIVASAANTTGLIKTLN